jgi:hypothetical protein
VKNPAPAHGDFTKRGLEGERPRPPALDAATAFAVPLMQNQFLVSLLNENSEKPALEFEPDLMNGGLDLVGEVLILVRHGQGNLQFQAQGERLVGTVDGTEGHGRLEVADVTHGGSPYSNDGVHRVCFSPTRLAKSLPWAGIALEWPFPILHNPPLVAHQLTSAYKIS